MNKPLGFQEALQQLTPEAAPEEATEAVTETAEVETPIEIEESHEEIELDLEDGGKEEIPAAELPSSWSKDDSDIWQELTPAAQEKVLERERQTQSDYSRRQNELSDAQKALDADREQIKQKQAELLEALKAVQVQKPSPDMLDPNHESHDPDEYHRLNAVWEKSQSEVAKIQEEIQNQQAEDLANWQASQAELYKQHWPEFLDVEKGPKLHNELIGFASDRMGITVEQATQALQTSSYHQMSILNDAMKYRQALDKAKASRQKPKTKSLKGGASNPKKPEVADKKALAAAFNRNPSKENALKLMGAK